VGEEAHDKLYTRTEYRRVIAWPERIRREAPFLAAVFAGAPVRRLLDVGCGSGEHTRHFAELGWTAVGIDVSERMMGEAAALAGVTGAGGSARFELRPAAEAARLPEAPFGGAMCVGNTLAFVQGEAAMSELLAGMAAALAPGAPLLIQLLNYERILGLPVRALPVNVRPLPEEEGEGEILFLRILQPRPDGNVDFYPATLTLRPGEEPEVKVREAKHFVHQGWTRPRLEPLLRAAGFEDIVGLGGMGEVPYDPLGSPDLVLRARRRSA
jgi:SAM-dependent methyltransferase